MPRRARHRARLRKLLILLAAYADAGESSPHGRELARRVRFPPERIDAMLKELIARRLLRVRWHGDPETRGRDFERPCDLDDLRRVVLFIYSLLRT